MSHIDRDWPEDAGENACYVCRCIHCREFFIGHKRRVVCKVCAFTLSVETRFANANPHCSGCGGLHPFDTTIPSQLWNAVIRVQDFPDYLCASCIIRVFAARGISFEAELSGEGVSGARLRLEPPEATPIHTGEINEGERQAILLALFKLKHERPGWDYFIGEIEKKLGGQLDWPEESAERRK